MKFNSQINITFGQNKIDNKEHNGQFDHKWIPFIKLNKQNNLK